MLELYSFPQSTCSQKTRFCLYAKGIDWHDRALDNRKGEHLTPEYLKLNPNGDVPTLVHDGLVVNHPSVIMEYIDEAFPDVPLSPPTPAGRARMRDWLRYLEDKQTRQIRFPSYKKYIMKGLSGLTAEERARRARRRPNRQYLFEHMEGDGFGEAAMTAAMADLQDSIDRVGAALATDGGPWLVGERISLADICLMPIVDRLDDLGMASMWADRPAVAAWYARIKVHPAFARTYRPGTRVSEYYGKAA